MSILILHRSASAQAAHEQNAEMIISVMMTLGKGKENMSPVEMRELYQATKDEMIKRGMAAAYMSSVMPEMEKELDLRIAREREAWLKALDQAGWGKRLG